jgi:hypothetical protein
MGYKARITIPARVDVKYPGGGGDRGRGSRKCAVKPNSPSHSFVGYTADSGRVWTAPRGQGSL